MQKIDSLYILKIFSKLHSKITFQSFNLSLFGFLVEFLKTFKFYFVKFAPFWFSGLILKYKM